MKFDTQNGSLDLPDGIGIHRGMVRAEVLATFNKWENWNDSEDGPRALRSIINLPNKNMSPKVILIVFFLAENQVIAGWDISPWDLADGREYHRVGKYLKRMRNWFKDMFNVHLPWGGAWGHVDARHDFWNKSAGIVCTYREGFADEEKWRLYKSSNKFS